MSRLLFPKNMKIKNKALGLFPSKFYASKLHQKHKNDNDFMPKVDKMRNEMDRGFYL